MSLLATACTMNPGSKTASDKVSKADKATLDYDKSPVNKPIEGKPASIDDLEKLSLDHKKEARLINATVIVTVNGEPITIGQYREEFKTKQLGVQTQMLSNPLLINHLLDLAKKNNVQLSADEKDQLLKQAKVAADTPGSFINKDIKAKAFDKKQFDKQILDTALAFKVACLDIEKNLLPEMINASLIIEQSKKDGFEKNAYQDFIDYKHKNDIKKVAGEHNLTENEFKHTFIDQELIQQEIDKIVGKPKVSEEEIADFYKTHLSEFKHGDRVKLKQIFVLAPQSDGPGFKSIKTQLKEKFPKANAKELADKEKAYMAQQGQKANAIMAQIQKGVSLDKLNPNKEKDIFIESDTTNKGSQFVEIAAMPVEMSTEIGKLKNGQFCPKIFKTAIGYQIVELVDKEKSGYLPLSEVKDYITQALTQQKAQTAVAAWLENARKTAKIVLSNDFMAVVEDKVKQENKEAAGKVTAPVASGQKTPDTANNKATQPSASSKKTPDTANDKTTTKPAPNPTHKP